MDQTKKPLKRHPILKDLSRDHQKMLLQARAIRWVASSDRRARPVEEVLASLREAWTNEIEQHLQEEEEILVPFCLAHDGTFHPLARQISNEHRWLRDHINTLTVDDIDRLAEFGRTLHDHIRFEERVVYDHIQCMLSPDDLNALGAKLRGSRIQRQFPTKRRRKPNQNNGT